MDNLAAMPLELDIAWYDQKAVAVLLALLHLGFKEIRFGPTLPDFLTACIIGKLPEASRISTVVHD